MAVSCSAHWIVIAHCCCEAPHSLLTIMTSKGLNLFLPSLKIGARYNCWSNSVQSTFSIVMWVEKDAENPEWWLTYEWLPVQDQFIASIRFISFSIFKLNWNMFFIWRLDFKCCSDQCVINSLPESKEDFALRQDVCTSLPLLFNWRRSKYSFWERHMFLHGWKITLLCNSIPSASGL